MYKNKELSLIWNVIRKKGLIIVFFIFLGLIIGVGISLMSKPTYTSTTTLLVNDQKSTSQKYQDDINLIKTYKDLIVSTAVLKPVVQNLDGDFSISDVKKMITVTTNDGSQVLSINVKSNSSNQSNEIANSVSDEFQSKLSSMMGHNYVTTIDRAQSDNQVKKTKNLFYVLISTVAFGGGALVVCWLVETSKSELKNDLKNSPSSRLSRTK